MAPKANATRLMLAGMKPRKRFRVRYRQREMPKRTAKMHASKGSSIPHTSTSVHTVVSYSRKFLWPLYALFKSIHCR